MRIRNPKTWQNHFRKRCNIDQMSISSFFFQCCGFWIRSSISSESGYGYGSRVLMSKNWKKYSWIFTYSCASIKESKVQEIKKMKFINFFLFLWVIFALLDPDPQHCFFLLNYLFISESMFGLVMSSGALRSARTASSWARYRYRSQLCCGFGMNWSGSYYCRKHSPLVPQF
jgi:hypothetical protein